MSGARNERGTALWHPFTQMSEYAAEGAPTIVAAEGCWLVDSEGRRYIDAVSSLWTNVHGHRHPRIDAAVSAQLGRFSHSTLLGLDSEPASRLAERLVEIAPGGLAHVFFSDNGSTAVEVALKVVFQYGRPAGSDSRRKTFLHFGNGYHGDTVGAVSVGGIPLFHERFGPLLFETVRAPGPYCYRCPLGLTRADCGLACADEFERLLDENVDRLAGVILEPMVQCAGGIITHPDGFLRRVADACRSRSVPLILDEVATGFGRTGVMFACQHESVAPDVMCLAKGITGGYLPLAATLFSEEIYQAFLGPFENAFFHGHTYTGNALACAAALASLDVFESEEVLRRLRGKTVLLGEALERFRDHPNVGDIRRRGFVAGVELVRDRATKEPFDPALRTGHKVTVAARGHGVITRPLGDVLVFFPPLAISEEELERLVEGVWRALCEVLPAS